MRAGQPARNKKFAVAVKVKQPELKQLNRSQLGADNCPVRLVIAVAFNITMFLVHQLIHFGN